ncbi:hypothetical protein NE237_005630 [Protea cynaroides]|uniref:Uncharacterized protein n=1 Tax=Protea cynaroides TaxID=273540 RepID=A0A9Q0KLK8_9MAGN|nr:hypothetical protein NE237_005630 [Protea cynaroides]
MVVNGSVRHNPMMERPLHGYTIHRHLRGKEGEYELLRKVSSLMLVQEHPKPGPWQPPVLSWDKEFCTVVGSIPWRKLLETQKVLYFYENVLWWNDSAGAKAFNNEKNHF